MKRIVPILSFVIISLLVGYVSKVIQEPAMQDLYPALAKSSLNPPGIVFAIVWPVLYLLMGISAGIIWNMRSIYTWLTMLLFFVQLGLNLVWSVTFFGFQSPIMGFLVLVLLLVAVVLYAAAAFMQNRIAAYLNVPYILWLLFAMYLNGYVMIYN
jgi:tryptophan-rich sensory protein